MQSNTAKKVVDYDVARKQGKKKDKSIDCIDFSSANRPEKRWHFLDLEAHDAEILAEERRRRKEARMRREAKRQEEIDTMLIVLFQKAIGIILVLGSLWICNTGIFYDPSTDINDCTGMVLFIFVGIALMFSKSDWISNR